MQSLEEFVAAHDGRYLDFDGVYGAQCVDLVLFYLRDVCALSPLPGNAIDEFGENPERITWVRNQPADLSQLPPRGSIMIWGPSVRVGTGSLGHTAVVLDAAPASFHSFDQNWPLGAACHVVAHTYDGIVGWGIPQGADMFDDGDKLELARVYAALFYDPNNPAYAQYASYIKLFEAKLKAAAALVLVGGLSAEQAQELKEAHDAVLREEQALKQA